MVAAKRPTASITNTELVEVAHLTYRDAALALGIGSMATVRLLYQKRGVPRTKRKRGELADYHTRAQYKTGEERQGGTVGNNPLGLKPDGSRVAQFWATMSEDMANRLGLSRACRDLGTEECLVCDLGEGQCLDDCDFKCNSCEYETVCPCSLYSWLKRQEAAQ